ncbi:MAG: SprB repeat-containing protein, partial [Bacteroidota bacterium]
MKQIFILCFIISICLPLHAQRSIFADSSQLEFFHGNYYGNWRKGKITGRHTYMRDPDKFDPYTEREIQIVPYGKRKVLRLGNKQVGAQADRITYTFRVTPKSSLFVYQYAIILQDPKHEEAEQPYFEITITDSTGKILDPKCGYYKVIAGPEAERKGFKKGPDKAMYKDWTTEAINLTPYIGKKIKVQFTVFDCEKTGHFGYAYMDAYYSALEVKIKYCRGDDFATLIAPEGFAKYSWSTGISASQKIIVPSDQINEEFSCTITSVTGCELTLKTEIVPQKLWVEGTPLIEPVSCSGDNDGRVELKVKNGFGPYKFLWNDGNTNQIREDLYEGDYQVIITDVVSCKDTVNFFVDGPEPIRVRKSVQDNLCFGEHKGSIELHMANAYKYSIRWDSLGEGFSHDQLPAGLYKYYIEGNGSCSSDTIRIKEPDKLRLMGKVTSDYGGYAVSCQGKKDGSIQWDIVGGTKPYFASYLWSEDTSSLKPKQTSLMIDQLSAGTYGLEIEDKNQCLAHDTVLLTMPDTIAIHANISDYEGFAIRCYGDSSGAISVQLSDGSRSGGNYNFSWTNSKGFYSTSRNLTGIPAGRYRIEVQNENGCMSSQTIVLKNPPKMRILRKKRLSLGFAQRDKFEVKGGTAPYEKYLDDRAVDELALWKKKKQKHILSATDRNGCSCERKIKFMKTRK